MGNMQRIIIILALGVVCCFVEDICSLGHNNYGLEIRYRDNNVDMPQENTISNHKYNSQHAKRFVTASDQKLTNIPVIHPEIIGRSHKNLHNKRQCRRNIIRNKKDVLDFNKKLDIKSNSQRKACLNDHDYNQYSQKLSDESFNLDNENQPYTPSENSEIIYDLTKKLTNNGSLMEKIRNVNTDDEQIQSSNDDQNAYNARQLQQQQEEQMIAIRRQRFLNMKRLEEDLWSMSRSKRKS